MPLKDTEKRINDNIELLRAAIDYLTDFTANGER